MNKLLVMLAFVSLMAACKTRDANELSGGTVKLTGSITGASDGWLELLVPSRENQKIDSIKIAKGKFDYTLSIKEPDLMVMRLAGVSGSELAFWGDPGSVSITGHKDSMWSSKIEGGPTQVLFRQMMDSISKINAPGRAIYTQYMMAQQSQNLEEAKKLEGQLIGIQTATRDFALNFARKNNGSVLAPYLGLVYLGEPGNESSLKPLFDTLSPAAKKTYFGKKLGELVGAAAVSSIGAPAPEFVMNDVNDKPISLSSLKGQYVLVDFWASWCKPCRDENPNVVKAYQTFKDKGFTVLGVSLDKEKDSWVKAISDDQLTWNHVSDLKFWDNAAAKLYRVQAIPANFLLNKEGIIIAKDLRGPALIEALSKMVK